MTAANINFQREVYEDKLIEALIDPTVAADLAKAIDAIKPTVYFVTQAATRGGFEVFDNILEDRLVPDEINPVSGKLERGTQGLEMLESAKEVTQPEQPLEDPQAMLDGLTVPQVGGDESIFEPIAAGPTIKPPFDPAMSPTIVPLDKDRELAMRARGNLGGIASLA